MKKNLVKTILKVACIAVVIVSLSVAITFGLSKTIHNESNLKEVKVAPDNWKDGVWLYEENTGVVYFKDWMNGTIIKLESADYEFYIYDEKNNEFVGYNR